MLLSETTADRRKVALIEIQNDYCNLQPCEFPKITLAHCLHEEPVLVFHLQISVIHLLDVSCLFKLKLTSHDILHYLWSADMSKSFSQSIVSIFTFLSQFRQYLSSLNIFFNRFQKCGFTPHCRFCDFLTLRQYTSCFTVS